MASSKWQVAGGKCRAFCLLPFAFCIIFYPIPNTQYRICVCTLAIPLLSLGAMNTYNQRRQILPPDAKIIPPSQQPQRYTPEMEYLPARPRIMRSAPMVAEDPLALTVAREMLTTIVPALLIAIAIYLFLAQATRVEGFSMEPTLYGHQRLIIEKISYRFHEPKRGDIVVLQVPGFDELLIKRVVGLPGDRIEIKNGVVYINGTPLDEPYVNGVARGNYPLLTVPEGYIFVMGDNRNNSNDSRSFGPVAIENIVGRAWMRYWPLPKLRLMP